MEWIKRFLRDERGGPETFAVIKTIGTVLSVASAAQSAFGGGKESPKAPADPKPPAGVGAEPDLSKFEVPGETNAPGFMGLSSQMTPLQQRSAITTGGVSGDASQFRDPAALDYYKNIIMRDVLSPEGTVKEGASVLPIERQYLQQVMGKTPQSDSVESFLTQLVRG